MVIGIAGIVISKVFMEHYKKYRNHVVSSGLYTGSVFLILTAIFSNWDSVSSEYKLLISGAGLIFVVWCSYRKKNKKDIIKETDKILDKSIEDIK